MGKNFITMRKLHALLFLVLATTQVKGFARTKKLPSSLLENSTDTAVRCGPWGLFRDCDDKNTKTRIRLCKYRRGEAPDLSNKRADLTESDWERMENFFKTTGPKDTEEYVHQPDIQTIPCDYVEHSTPSHGTGSHYGELPRLNVSSREFDPDRSNSHKNSHNGHQDSTADFKIDHKIEEIHDINGIDGYKSTDKKIESPKVPTVDTTYSSLSKNRNKDDKKRNNGGKKRKNDDKRNKEDKKRKRGERRRKNEEKLISQKDAEELARIRLESELATLKSKKDAEELEKIKLQSELATIKSKKDAEDLEKIKLQEQLDTLKSKKDADELEKIKLQSELATLKAQKESEELSRIRLESELDTLKAQKESEELEKIKLQSELATLKSQKESEELSRIRLESELDTLKAQKESEEQARIRLQEEQNRIISENQMALEEQKREFDAELERQNSELQKQLEQIRIDLEHSDRERRLLEKELSDQLQIQKENDPDKILELERARLRDEWNREQETIKRKWEKSQEHLRKEMIRMQKELEEQDRIKAQKESDELARIRLESELATLKSKKESEEQARIRLESELATLKSKKESEEQARIRLQEEQNRIISENQMALEEQKREFDAELERQNSELQKQLEQIRIDLERSDRERRLLEKELSEQLQIQKENEERNSSTDQTGKNELPLIPASAGGLKSEISQSDVEIKPPFGGHDFPESGLSPMKRDDSSIEFNSPPKDSVSVSDSDYNKSMNNIHLPHPKLDLKSHNTSTHNPESTENTPNHHDEKVNKVETNTAKGGEVISSDEQLSHGSKESNIDNIKSSTRLSDVSRVPTLLPPGGPLVPEPEESADKMSESMKNSGTAEVLDSESHNTSHTPNTHNTMNTSHRVELPDSTHEEDTDTYDDEEEFSDDEEEFSDGNDTGQAVKLPDSTHENEGNTADDTEHAKRYENSEELDSRVSSRPVHPHEVAAQSPEFKPTKQHDSDEPKAHRDVDGADHSDDMDEPENTDGVDELDQEAEDYYDEGENSEDENDEGNFSRGAKIAGGIIGALIAIGAAGTGYHFTSKRKAEVIELDEIDFDYAQVGDCEEVETAVLITEDVWENEA